MSNQLDDLVHSQQLQSAAIGFLAEEYDGIGQYVMVSMSRVSTDAAIKARVAAGDTRGNRKFPAGTRVLVFSNHGELEVLSLSVNRILCSFDDFKRVEPVSLGSTPGGFVYQTLDGFPSVDGEYAIADYSLSSSWDVLFGYPNTALPVPPEFQQDTFIMNIRWKQDAAVSGSDLFEFIWHPANLSETFRWEIDINAIGSAVRVRSATANDTESVASMNDTRWYRAQLDYQAGDHARTKAWAEDDGDPGVWQAQILGANVPSLALTTVLEWIQSGNIIQARKRFFDQICFG